MIPLKDNIPNERFPFVTVALVLINIVAYLLSIRHGGSFFGGPSNTTVVHDAAIPYDLSHPGKYCTVTPVVDEFGRAALESKCKSGPFPGQIPTWETVFTSMFMHGGFLHIAGNMLFLAIFGPNVEDRMGSLAPTAAPPRAAAPRPPRRSPSTPARWLRRSAPRARSRRRPVAAWCSPGQGG